MVAGQDGRPRDEIARPKGIPTTPDFRQGAEAPRTHDIVPPETKAIHPSGPLTIAQSIMNKGKLQTWPPPWRALELFRPFGFAYAGASLAWRPGISQHLPGVARTVSVRDTGQSEQYAEDDATRDALSAKRSPAERNPSEPSMPEDRRSQRKPPRTARTHLARVWHLSRLGCHRSCHLPPDVSRVVT